jgi:hypothetical protein
MANELDPKFGTAITLIFGKSNIAANGITDLTFVSGGVGFKVPTGYAFHPVLLHAETNADITAGTGTFKVIDNGTELVNGPSAVLSDLVQAASDVERYGVEPIAAGHVVGVSITTTAAYAPETGDVDAVLVGYLVPA